MKFQQVKAGDRFGFLEAVCDGWMEKKKQQVMCKCLKCGSEEPKQYQVGNIRGKSAHTTSCGCVSKLAASQRFGKPVLKGAKNGWMLAISNSVSDGCGHRVKCICTRCNDGVVYEKYRWEFAGSKSCRKCCMSDEQNVKHKFARGDLLAGGNLCVLDVLTGSKSPFSRKTRAVRCVCLRCNKGNIFTAGIGNILHGGTTSCGCYALESRSVAAVRDLCANLKHYWVYRKGSVVIPMRSSWELAVAHSLDEKGLAWEYEPKTFVLDNGVRYTPDFFVAGKNLWIEVKGRRMPGFDCKQGMFAQGHNLLVVDRNNIKEFTGISPWQIRTKFFPAKQYRVPKGEFCEKETPRKPVLSRKGSTPRTRAGKGAAVAGAA